MTDEKAIAVIGLSDSGKSTWLGALCDVIVSNNEGRLAPLRFNGLPEDFEQLRLLRSAILRGEYPHHTPPETSNKLTYPLVRSANGNEERFDLDVSDYSGERISRLYTRADQKPWDSHWEERASRNCMALMIRADDIRHLERRNSQQDSPTDGLLSSDLIPDREDTSRRLPTALALIEAMQAMRAWRRTGLGHRKEYGVDRIAVLLTAWDTTSNSERSSGATAFLDSNAPLLAAWLRSNIRPKDLQIFGLSATGGDLNDPAHADRVRKEGVAKLAYVEWSSPPVRKHDVALPLDWLLSGQLPSTYES